MDKRGKNKQKLNVREKKFIAAKVQGKTNLAAYEEAGYSVASPISAKVNSSKLKNKPHIKQAIEDALALHGATPEWAVSQLKKIAEQDDEMGAKRLATMNILELHGWNKADRPTLELNIKNASFFNQSRKFIEQDNGDED